jgi:exosortase
MNTVRLWSMDGNSSHGYIIPFAALYLVWRKRTRLAEMTPMPSRFGIVVFTFGLMLFSLASVADVEFIGPLSFWICIVGIVFHVLGRAMVKVITFPLAFLLFMIPWPDFLTEAVSFPLQLWSTKYTVMVAGLFGVPAVQDGTSLYSGDLSFQVIAACSGIRSMVILLAIGAILAHLLQGSIWRKAGLFLAAIPIALVANVIRLFSIVLVGRWFGQEVASKVFHEWTSPILFLLCSILLLILWLILEPKPEKSA